MTEKTLTITVSVSLDEIAHGLGMAWKKDKKQVTFYGDNKRSVITSIYDIVNGIKERYKLSKKTTFRTKGRNLIITDPAEILSITVQYT